MSDQSPLGQIVQGVLSKSESVAAGGWLDRVLATGQQKVDDLSPALRAPARKLLETLATHKGELADVSQAGLLAIVSKLALGKPEEAQAVYAASAPAPTGDADFDADSATLAGDAAATQKEVADRAEAWAKVKKLSLELLADLGHAAIPLLLAL